MRIIGGTHSGLRFTPPANIPARPTTDIAKEGLFNILNNSIDFEEITFLDLFGGTGSISYEIASRGCKNISIVELDKRSITFIETTVKKHNFPITIFKIDVFKYLQNCKQTADLIFAGPPYPLPNLPTIPDKIFEHNILSPNGLFILEHNPKHNFDAHPKFTKKRNYGTTIFSFFKLTNS